MGAIHKNAEFGINLGLCWRLSCYAICWQPLLRSGLGRRSRYLRRRCNGSFCAEVTTGRMTVMSALLLELGDTECLLPSSPLGPPNARTGSIAAIHSGRFQAYDFDHLPCLTRRRSGAGKQFAVENAKSYCFSEMLIDFQTGACYQISLKWRPGKP